MIRLADPEDALAVARVHVRCWQIAYRNLLPSEYLNSLRAEDRAAKYNLANRDPQNPRTIVAAEGSSILGFATVSPATEEDMQNTGELCALYVDPESWGRSIGAALTRTARSLMFEHGFLNALLWLLSGNVRAARFYHIDGWTTDGVRRTVKVWDVEANEVRYVRPLRAEQRKYLSS